MKPKKLELDIKNHESLPKRPFVKEAHKLELMYLSPQLKYAFLGNDSSNYWISQWATTRVCGISVKYGSSKLLGGPLRTLLDYLPVFVLTTSNSCRIIILALSIRED